MGWVARKIKRFKEMGIINSLKLCRDRMMAPFIPKYIEKRWNKKPAGYMGICSKTRNKQLIVSLTTYPKRIGVVHLVIKSLLCQTIKPDKIILWLAEEQFPNKEKDLPKELLELEKYGLTICWCNDIRSYKKLIPTIKKYPDSYIITFDDDLYYLPSTVERLYKAALKNPHMIHCHRGTKIIVNDDNYITIPGGYVKYNKPTFLHKLTGCSGVCYPPNVLHEDVINEKLFMKLAPTNDDIWFWLMGVLKGTKCNIINNNLPGLFEIPTSQQDSLNSINDNGSCLFWKDFNAILTHYPELKEILKKEYYEVHGINERKK